MNNFNLHQGHTELLCAALQGGDLQTAYGALWPSNQRVNSTRLSRAVMRIRTELSNAAKRHGRPQTARLIRIDAVDLISKLDQKLPLLSEFVLTQALECYSLGQQRTAYVETYGVGRSRSARLVQLVAKQWAQLPWLEQVATQKPMPTDLVDHWLSPLLATRLHGAGVSTLGALVNHINDLGPRWWIKIPSFTSIKAERIARWLRIHKMTVGIAMGTSFSHPVVVDYAQTECSDILFTKTIIFSADFGV